MPNTNWTIHNTTLEEQVMHNVVDYVFHVTSFPTNILFYFCVIFESCAHTEILVVTVSAHEILLNSIACKRLP